jgi:hypothetical protein
MHYGLEVLLDKKNQLEFGLKEFLEMFPDYKESQLKKLEELKEAISLMEIATRCIIKHKNN